MTDTRDDGGPAFKQSRQYDPGYSGMSLRDYIAVQALPAVIAADDFWREGYVAGHARMAYAYADAMLAERAKK